MRERTSPVNVQSRELGHGSLSRMRNAIGYIYVCGQEAYMAGGPRVRAHFHVSLPSLRSTCKRSTIHRERSAEVNGVPSGPGVVPRCLRLCAETNAESAFFP
eukprot:559047-Pleurochrysis_carterae.AAC.1